MVGLRPEDRIIRPLDRNNVVYSLDFLRHAHGQTFDAKRISPLIHLRVLLPVPSIASLCSGQSLFVFLAASSSAVSAEFPMGEPRAIFVGAWVSKPIGTHDLLGLTGNSGHSVENSPAVILTKPCIDHVPT